MTTVLELYPDRWHKELAANGWGEVERDAESWLSPCPCGGQRRPAVSFLPRSVLPYDGDYVSGIKDEKRGWWVQSWQRDSGIVLEGHSVRNPWAERVTSSI